MNNYFNQNVMGYYRKKYNNPNIVEIQVAYKNNVLYKVICCPIDLQQLILEYKKLYDKLPTENNKLKFNFQFGFNPEDILVSNHKNKFTLQNINNYFINKNIKATIYNAGIQLQALNSCEYRILIKRTNELNKING